MVKIAPPKRRSMVQDGPLGLEVSFPAKRSTVIMLFLTAWLGGWAMGEITVVGQLLSGNAKGGSWFLLFWLAGWTLAGGFAIYIWLWMLAGRERVLLRPDSLIIRREVFGVGRPREFDLAHVSSIRVSPLVSDPWSQGMRFWGIGGGLIAFDYGARTIRFGAGVDEAEAAQVVSELKARHGA